MLLSFFLPLPAWLPSEALYPTIVSILVSGYFVYYISTFRKMLERGQAPEIVVPDLGPPSVNPPWNAYPIGYPRLAERIAHKPETGIYRRFDALNAKHLLYLQAEITMLENTMRLNDEWDSKSEEGRIKEFRLDWRTILEADPHIRKPRIARIEKLHKLMNQYNKALIQTSILQKLQGPDTFDLVDVQCWLDSDDNGPPWMSGQDRYGYGFSRSPHKYAPDLVTMQPRVIEDKLSRFICDNLIDFFIWVRKLLGRYDEQAPTNNEVFCDSTVLQITMWTTSIVASLLPVFAILVLIKLETFDQKLGAMAAINVTMSTLLLILTGAKRHEIFALTAALTAVEVVFVGYTTGNPTKNM